MRQASARKYNASFPELFFLFFDFRGDFSERFQPRPSVNFLQVSDVMTHNRDTFPDPAVSFVVVFVDKAVLINAIKSCV